MEFPGEVALGHERVALVETLESLTPDEFDHGPTLCAGWAPRDVLGHLLGVDSSLLEYGKALGNVRKANTRIVEKSRRMSRDRLLHRAHHWAEHPAPGVRSGSMFFLGDVAVHHQDILRPLHRSYDLPAASRNAIFREGFVLGGFMKLTSYRLEPTDGGRVLGRGTVVRGTRDVLGLWLAGRQGVEDDLEFVPRS